MVELTEIPTVTLNNGVEIPQLGFGVFKVPPTETVDVVTEAVAVGFRHFDTAQMYQNEAGVAEALRRSGIDRSEFFVTSKLDNRSIGFDDALAAFESSVEVLGQIDLYLIHWPIVHGRDFVATWKALETVYAAGRVRAIGVSNFQIDHLLRLFDETEVVPAVNQIEDHPYLVQDELVAFDADRGIATEAWSPLARSKVLSEPLLVEIASRHGKTTAQVVLRWHLQRGSIVIPKTASPERMRENFAVFDFVLSDDELAAISTLGRNERTGPHPDTPKGEPR
jgi:2,5-diketo-D-gluconate reductase A